LPAEEHWPFFAKKRIFAMKTMDDLPSDGADMDCLINYPKN